MKSDITFAAYAGSVEFDFQLDGDPTAWKRAGRNKRQGRTFDTQKRDKRLIRGLAALAMREAGVKMAEKGVAVELVVLGYFEIPPSVSKKEARRRLESNAHTQKPDLDNLVKLIKDALSGLAYADDCQITESYQNKVWTSRQGRTTVKVRIRGAV